MQPTRLPRRATPRAPVPRTRESGRDAPPGGSRRLPGSLGPELIDIKSKYPNRADLVAIITDETLRNPLTVMPPFGRNRILTEKEIEAVVDFLQTL